MAGLGIALSALGSADAAPGRSSPAPTLTDMSGLWERVTPTRNDHYDPNTGYGLEQTPPLNDAYMKIWKDNFARSEKGDLSYDPSSKCLPKGFPRILMAPYGLEILATPKQVNLYNEASEETARVYLDGRRPEPDADPGYVGFTTGIWANGVLTAKTVNLRSDTLFDSSGIQHSDALTVTQKIRFLDKDTLEDMVTASDPKAFTKDWMVRMVFKRQPASRSVRESVCLENSRNAPPAKESH